MIDEITVKEVLEHQGASEYLSIIQKVDMDTKVDCNYGMELMVFDESDIEWLLRGKALYVECNGGEYAHVFVMKIKEEKR